MHFRTFKPLGDVSKIARYAVMGHPVAHSQSPWIQACFAAQQEIKMVYTRVCAPLEGFSACARQFFAEGGHGLNVTLPFKRAAYTLADIWSPRAIASGSVNTLRADAQGLYGDNTDGVGLIRDIEDNLKVALKQCRILLLGAGGAARGVLPALIETMPDELVIVNRTAARAVDLAQYFAPLAKRVGCTLVGGGPNTARGPFEAVINATSASLNAAQPCFNTRAITTSTLAYELMYGAQPSPFMQTAQQLGARVSDGLGMLVEQAAESFFVWRGVRPECAPVLTQLRARILRCHGPSQNLIDQTGSV